MTIIIVLFRNFPITYVYHILILNYPIGAVLRKDKGSWNCKQNKNNFYRVFFHNYSPEISTKDCFNYFVMCLIRFSARVLADSFYHSGNYMRLVFALERGVLKVRLGSGLSPCVDFNKTLSNIPIFG